MSRARNSGPHGGFKYSRKVCHYYLHSTCRYGHDCKYIHESPNRNYPPARYPSSFNRRRSHHSSMPDESYDGYYSRPRSSRGHRSYRHRESRRSMPPPPPPPTPMREIYTSRRRMSQNPHFHPKKIQRKKYVAVTSSTPSEASNNGPTPPLGPVTLKSKANTSSTSARHESQSTSGGGGSLSWSAKATAQRIRDKFLDKDLPTLVFDIDGTLLDISPRLQLPDASVAPGSNKYWDIVLDGKNYHMDRAIEVSRQYLSYIQELDKYNIVYLSGRRDTTLHYTKKSLFNDLSYPNSYIVHRPKGMNSKIFKWQQLKQLSETYNIVAYFGDRIIDDCLYCIRANVRPVLVVPNQWLYEDNIDKGLSSVIRHIIKNDNKEYPRTDIEEIKNSKYWNMSYEDLIPKEFATDTYAHRYNVWPPIVKEREEFDKKSNARKRSLKESEETNVSEGNDGSPSNDENMTPT